MILIFVGLGPEVKGCLGAITKCPAYIMKRGGCLFFLVRDHDQDLKVFADLSNDSSDDQDDVVREMIVIMTCVARNDNRKQQTNRKLVSVGSRGRSNWR